MYFALWPNESSLENNSDIKPHEGNIVDLSGKILGKHQGLYRYTIGQRKGLGISYKFPLFVIGFNFVFDFLD